MPKNVIMHAGPSILSIASSIPRRSDKASMISTAAAHFVVAGGPIVINCLGSAKPIRCHAV